MTGLALSASAQQTLFTMQTPVLTGQNDGVPYELGMKFQSSVNGQITAIRYWKDANDAGSHTGNIWSSSGTRLASVTFAGETPSGWQQQALPSPITINANTTYVVSVNINSRYVDTVGGLFFPISNGALISIADNHNGLFGHPWEFPTQTFGFSNYFRDVVFTPGVSNPPQPAGCLQKLVSVDGGKSFAAYTNSTSPALAQPSTPVEFKLVVTNCGDSTVTPGTVDDCINADPNAFRFACAPVSAGGQGGPGLILYEPPVPAPTSGALAPGASVTYSKTQLPNLSIAAADFASLCRVASQLTPPQTVVRNDAEFDGMDANAVSYEGVAYVKCPPVTAQCTIPGVTISNTSWNQFSIPAGTNPVVWVHAHIGKPSGVSTTMKSAVLFTRASLILNSTVYPLPEGLVTFDPAAPSVITTVFNAAQNRWETLVNPNSLSDEIFFLGAAIPVTPAIAAGARATFTFTVFSEDPKLSFPWQWSAAVYTYWPSDWNQAKIQPYHDSYHAGTPLNTVVQKSLIQGPRGGGGSNFTGSWSATGTGTCP